MLKPLLIVLFALASLGSIHAQIVITAVYDADLPGGLPKGVELYATDSITDFSLFGIGSANNGQGTDGEEYTFPAVSVAAGTYIYVSSDSAAFADFFGFNPDYVTDGNPNAMAINGDDAVELFNNGAVIDVFGDINMDGTGTPWEYLDGWAARKPSTGPDGSTFIIQNWTFSGPGGIDGDTTNATASNPIPIKTYTDTTVIGPDVTVILQNLAFIPRDITIEVGDIVRWTNIEDNVEHNVNGNNSLFPCNPVSFRSGDAEVGPWDYDFQFNQAGFYEYQCDPHISFDMFGSVTVIDPDAPEYPSRNIGVMTTVDNNGKADSVDRKCTLDGIVYGPNYRPGGLQFTIIDENGDGIGVFKNGSDCYEPSQGDRIQIEGTITQFNGLTQIEPEGQIVLVSEDNTLGSPTVVETAIGEEHESQYILVNNILIDSVVATGSSGWNAFASNSNASYTVRFDADIFDSSVEDLKGMRFNITGIGGQFDSSTPYDEGYQLVATSPDDIVVSSVWEVLDSDAVTVYPNPARDILHVVSDREIISIDVFDNTGRHLRHVDRRNTVDLSGCSSGVYVLRVITSAGLWNGRAILAE